MDAPNHCGTCTACCRVFSIPEMPERKAGAWCQHCAVGKGCTIYQERPPTCVNFECVWLTSQQRPGDELAPELRPDRSKVVFTTTTNPHIFAAITMPDAPRAWQRGDVMTVIGRLVGGGFSVVVGGPVATRRIMFDRNGSHPVDLSEPDERGMQWHTPASQ